jgi:Flp pilus assembly pilin Flp
MLKKGQSVLEYAILIAIISAAFAAMAMYVRRAVQGKLYKIEEQAIGRQNQTRRM